MGIMIIPFISSFDDVTRAVPQSLRDGAFALGSTKGETVTQVVLPAAFPVLVGAFLLAVVGNWRDNDCCNGSWSIC